MDAAIAKEAAKKEDARAFSMDCFCDFAESSVVFWTNVDVDWDTNAHVVDVSNRRNNEDCHIVVYLYMVVVELLKWIGIARSVVCFWSYCTSGRLSA